MKKYFIFLMLVFGIKNLHAQTTSSLFSKLDHAFNLEAATYLKQLQAAKSKDAYSLEVVKASENASNRYFVQDSVSQNCDSTLIEELLSFEVNITKLEALLLGKDTFIVISEYFSGVSFDQTLKLFVKDSKGYQQHQHIHNCFWEVMTNQPSDLWERVHNFLTAIDYAKYIKGTRVNKAMVVYFVRGNEIEVFILISDTRGIPGFYALFDK